jgi:hypothetical protein
MKILDNYIFGTTCTCIVGNKKAQSRPYLIYYRDLLAYVYIPVVQRELDVFRECVWNNHRTRTQKGKELPAGVPEHIFHFPEKYGGEQCGIDITEEQLLEVAELSNVIMEDTDDYLRPAVCKECEKHLPKMDEIKPSDAKDAYLYLKAHVDEDVF